MMFTRKPSVGCEMLLYQVLFAFLMLLGCEVEVPPDTTYWSDDYADSLLDGQVNSFPSELVSHFPKSSDLGKGWKVAYLSKGLQSAKFVQLETPFDRDEYDSVVQKLKGVGLWKTEKHIHGLQLLFDDERINEDSDEVFLGKETGTPDLFGAIVRRNECRIVYFARWD